MALGVMDVSPQTIIQLASPENRVGFPQPFLFIQPHFPETANMPIHLQRELNYLNKLILQMGGLVEENVRHAILALRNRGELESGGDPRKRDHMVNSLEIKVEEECLKILALHQPVASDLRQIVAVMKINNDLERIGDLAEHIARRSTARTATDAPAFPSWIDTMAGLTREMLRESLDAMVRLDLDGCRNVLHRDKEVDECNQKVQNWFVNAVKESPEHVETYTQALLTARELERIGDHTCNIAEDVIYLASGEIVRHIHTDERVEREQ